MTDADLEEFFAAVTAADDAAAGISPASPAASPAAPARPAVDASAELARRGF